MLGGWGYRLTSLSDCRLGGKTVQGFLVGVLENIVFNFSLGKR